MKVLVAFALVAISATAAWPSYILISDAPTDVTKQEIQKDVSEVFYKIFEPLRDPQLKSIAESFKPEQDLSQYSDGGVAIQRLLKELKEKHLLQKKQYASDVDVRPLQEEIMLFEVLMQCKHWLCFKSNTVYFREQVNEGEFITAVYAAIKHSPLTQEVVLPAIYEVMPHYFTKTQVIEDACARQEYSLRNQYIQQNFTGTLNNIEQRLAYFREDIGLATHHLMMNLENPHWWNDTYGYHIDRKGENFFYAYHQILNRYDAERISNHLPLVEELQLDEPLKEGFNPQTSYKFGAPFPMRSDDIQLQDVDQIGTIHELVHIEDRIHDAIALGYVVDEQGTKKYINNDLGITVLGDIIQSSLYSPNPKYYGHLTTLAYKMLDRQTDPKNKYDLPPGVLSHLELITRDPVAYRLHKRIDNIFREHIDQLPSYTKEQLEFSGIVVDSVRIEGDLETYLEDYQYDLINVFSQQGTNIDETDIHVVTSRLNHKQFTYKINVKNNNGGQKKALVRILAMPYRDGNGVLIPFDEGRWQAIELDLFLVTLDGGDNYISRRSSESSITVPDVVTYRELYDNAQSGVDMKRYESATGIPNRLLLPKGNQEGVQFRLLVAVTDAQKDVNDETIITSQKYHHYGVHGVQPDKRPFGYPLDRRITDEQVFLDVPNFKEIMVKVYNHNEHVSTRRPVA